MSATQIHAYTNHFNIYVNCGGGGGGGGFGLPCEAMTIPCIPGRLPCTKAD